MMEMIKSFATFVAAILDVARYDGVPDQLVALMEKELASVNLVGLTDDNLVRWFGEKLYKVAEAFRRIPLQGKKGDAYNGPIAWLARGKPGSWIEKDSLVFFIPRPIFTPCFDPFPYSMMVSTLDQWRRLLGLPSWCLRMAPAAMLETLLKPNKDGSPRMLPSDMESSMWAEETKTGEIQSQEHGVQLLPDGATRTSDVGKSSSVAFYLPTGFFALEDIAMVVSRLS